MSFQLFTFVLFFFLRCKWNFRFDFSFSKETPLCQYHFKQRTALRNVCGDLGIVYTNKVQISNVHEPWMHNSIDRIFFITVEKLTAILCNVNYNFHYSVYNCNCAYAWVCVWSFERFHLQLMTAWITAIYFGSIKSKRGSIELILLFFTFSLPIHLMFYSNSFFVILFRSHSRGPISVGCFIPSQRTRVFQYKSWNHIFNSQ